MYNSKKLLFGSLAFTRTSLIKTGRNSSAVLTSAFPGEPPIKSLAAQAAEFPSPKEGLARTRECPPPAAEAGYGADGEYLASNNIEPSRFVSVMVPPVSGKLPV